MIADKNTPPGIHRKEKRAQPSEGGVRSLAKNKLFKPKIQRFLSQITWKFALRARSPGRPHRRHLERGEHPRNPQSHLRKQRSLKREAGKGKRRSPGKIHGQLFRNLRGMHRHRAWSGRGPHPPRNAHRRREPAQAASVNSSRNPDASHRRTTSAGICQVPGFFEGNVYASTTAWKCDTLNP